MAERKVVEGEIVRSGREQRKQERRFEGAPQPLRSGASGTTIVSAFALLLSWIPVIGLTLGLVSLAVALARRGSVLMPIIAITIGSVSTAIFLIIAGLLSLIF